jgi:hypothetical protein
MICGLIAALSSSRSAHAGETFLWNSSATANWTDTTRWSPNGLPGDNDETDKITIGQDAGNGGAVILNSAVPSLAGVSIGGGGTGTLRVQNGGSLATTGTGDAIGLNGLGVVVMTGGALTLGGRLDVDHGIVQQSAGIFKLVNTTLGNLNFGISAPAQWTHSGTAQLEVGVDLNLGPGGSGIFQQGGGSVRVHRNVNVGSIFGDGQLILLGGQFLVDGVLRVGYNSTGRINLASTTADIQVGSLDLEPSSTFDLDLGRTTAAIHAGTASLRGSLDVDFTFAPTVGAVFPFIVTSTGAPSATTFTGKPQNSVFVVDAPLGAMPVRINYTANTDAGAAANDVTITVLKNGDLNFDGVVNRADVAKLIHGFGSAADFPGGDLNGDGLVDLRDVMRMQREMTASGASAAGISSVPEPGSWALLIGAIPGLLACGRRRR